RAHVIPPAAAAHGADLPPPAAALSGGDRVVRPPPVRSRGLELVRVGARRDMRGADGARLLLAQPVPLCVERPRPDAWLAAGSADPRGASLDPAPLAAVGLDCGAARRPVPRQLADHPGPHPRVLRTRLARRSSAR